MKIGARVVRAYHENYDHMVGDKINNQMQFGLLSLYDLYSLSLSFPTAMLFVVVVASAHCCFSCSSNFHLTI